MVATQKEGISRQTSEVKRVASKGLRSDHQLLPRVGELAAHLVDDVELAGVLARSQILERNLEFHRHRIRTRARRFASIRAAPPGSQLSAPRLVLNRLMLTLTWRSLRVLWDPDARRTRRRSRTGSGGGGIFRVADIGHDLRVAVDQGIRRAASSSLSFSAAPTAAFRGSRWLLKTIVLVFRPEVSALRSGTMKRVS